MSKPKVNINVYQFLIIGPILKLIFLLYNWILLKILKLFLPEKTSGLPCQDAQKQNSSV